MHLWKVAFDDAAGAEENNACRMRGALVESGFSMTLAGAKKNNAFWMQRALAGSGF